MAGRHKVAAGLAVAAACGVCLAWPTFAAERSPWTRPGCSLALDGAGAAQAGPGPASTDQVSGGTMESGFQSDGSAYVRVMAGDLEVTKTVTRSGEFSIRLLRGDDAVVIRVGPGTLAVIRGTGTAEIDLNSADEDHWLAVQSLLAGSRSVRAMRVLGAGLAPGAERSPGGLALILTDAVVGLVDGDVSAVRRVAQRFGRKAGTVRLARKAPGCYERWEGEVMRAWDDYLDCEATYLGNMLWHQGCSFRWMLWVESAWFAFLKCAGSPFINQ